RRGGSRRGQPAAPGLLPAGAVVEPYRLGRLRLPGRLAGAGGQYRPRAAANPRQRLATALEGGGICDWQRRSGVAQPTAVSLPGQPAGHPGRRASEATTGSHAPGGAGGLVRPRLAPLSAAQRTHSVAGSGEPRLALWTGQTVDPLGRHTAAVELRRTRRTARRDTGQRLRRMAGDGPHRPARWPLSARLPGARGRLLLVVLPAGTELLLL